MSATGDPFGRIVVGVDGSDEARAALAWALDEAAMRDSPLEVLHASRDETRALELISDDVAAVGPAAGLVPVVRSAVIGSPAGALVDRSEGAALVVVGRSGRGSHPFLGTVADQVAHHARCPVAVVPPSSQPLPPRVVVGVDGSDGACAALRWAHEEAAARRAECVALMAWGFLDQHPVPGGPPFDPHYDEVMATEALRASVEAALGSGAAGVDLQVVNDLPVAALLRGAESAQLLVTGSRGLGGFRSLLLGSVSRALIERSPVPTVVVR
jgi:nucleotide-binding universal stress UspA family protein